MNPTRTRRVTRPTIRLQPLELTSLPPRETFDDLVRRSHEAQADRLADRSEVA